jgi:hypothetical protein
MTTAERFWKKTRRDGDCIVWTGTKNQFGYGRFWNGTKQVCAHRWSYESVYGPIPSSKLFACHRCDNPPCVNPEHIFIGTAHDNMQDALAKGRLGGPKSTTRRDAKLSDADVVNIRHRVARGELQKHLAVEYGVSRGLITHYVTGIARARIGGPIRRRTAILTHPEAS